MLVEGLTEALSDHDAHYSWKNCLSPAGTPSTSGFFFTNALSSSFHLAASSSSTMCLITTVPTFLMRPIVSESRICSSLKLTWGTIYATISLDNRPQMVPSPRRRTHLGALCLDPGHGLSKRLYDLAPGSDGLLLKILVFPGDILLQLRKSVRPCGGACHFLCLADACK